MTSRATPNGPTPDREPQRKLVERVAKLLAMAEGTPNPHEADAFSQKAAALIAAHRIDPEHLRLTSTDPLDVLQVPLGRGAYVRARLALLQAVADAHGCHTVFRTRRSGTVALVAGFRSDLTTVELLHTSLHSQAASRMAAERRATGAATQRWRRSFLFGYAHQVARMLESTAADADRAAGTGGRAVDVLPALQDRDRRVAAYVSERFGRVGTARPAAAPTVTGYTAGRDAATRADVGRAQVPGRRALGRSGRSS